MPSVLYQHASENNHTIILETLYINVEEKSPNSQAEVDDFFMNILSINFIN